MPDRFGFSLSSRPRLGRWAVYAIALCGLAAAWVAVLPAVIGAATAESMMPHMSALEQTPAPGKSSRDCSNGCPEIVVLPQGSFTMGVPAGEEERENWPKERRGLSVPQHVVTIQHEIAIGKFDVTRDEYAQFVAETHRPDADSSILP